MNAPKFASRLPLLSLPPGLEIHRTDPMLPFVIIAFSSLKYAGQVHRLQLTYRPPLGYASPLDDTRWIMLDGLDIQNALNPSGSGSTSSRR